MTLEERPVSEIALPRNRSFWLGVSLLAVLSLARIVGT